MSVLDQRHVLAVLVAMLSVAASLIALLAGIAWGIATHSGNKPPACEGVLDRDEIPADAYPEPVERKP